MPAHRHRSRPVGRGRGPWKKRRRVQMSLATHARKVHPERLSDGADVM